MSYRVLVVDDTNFMRKMSTDYLTQYGYVVAGEAANGKEAIEQYEKLKPDIVMMDLTMPEMNGIDAIKEILRIDPKAVVLVCSASNQQNLIFDALDAGAKGYIMKPFNPSHMNNIIRKYAVPHLTTEDAASSADDISEDEVYKEIAATMEKEYTEEKEPNIELQIDEPREEKVMDAPKKYKPSFVTSYMCSWQEEINGKNTVYSVKCTENENKFVVEMKGDDHEEKQTIEFSLNGFRGLIEWLNDQMGDTKKIS